MYKFDEKVRKSAITGLIIHGVFIVAAIIVAISMKNWAMGYWVAILPAIPTMLVKSKFVCKFIFQLC